MTHEALAPLLAAMVATQEWLKTAGVEFAVVGGVAAAIHGRPRVTKDVDLLALADLDDLEELVARGASFGLTPREDDAIAFARTTRVLLLLHAPSGIEVDVSFGALPFERDLVENSIPVRIDAQSFLVARPEDILVMKALAMRPRDVADIEGILVLHPELDLTRVRATLAEFSAALEEADLVAEFERLVARTRRVR